MTTERLANHLTSDPPSPIAPNAALHGGQCLRMSIAQRLDGIPHVRVPDPAVRHCPASRLLDGVARKDGNAELLRRFNKDLYPALGKTAVSRVSEHDIRALIRTVVNRGAHRQAISFFADLTQMFSWARKRQPWRALLVEGDPTELVDITPLIAERVLRLDFGLS